VRGHRLSRLECAITLETVGRTVSSGAGAERAYRGP
jgi:hypothetical protein